MTDREKSYHEYALETLASDIRGYLPQLELDPPKLVMTEPKLFMIRDGRRLERPAPDLLVFTENGLILPMELKHDLNSIRNRLHAQEQLLWAYLFFKHSGNSHVLIPSGLLVRYTVRGEEVRYKPETFDFTRRKISNFTAHSREFDVMMVHDEKEYYTPEDVMRLAA